MNLVYEAKDLRILLDKEVKKNKELSESLKEEIEMIKDDMTTQNRRIQCEHKVERERLEAEIDAL